MARIIGVLLAGMASLMFASTASAALVQADFNDLSPGPVKGQGGGVGLAGTWDGSSTIAVVSGDLSAPASTNFAMTQSGSAQSLRQPAGTISGNNVQRFLTTPLTDTVWFSFLLRPKPDRGGIDLDSGRILDVDGKLLLALDGYHYMGTYFSAGQDALVLGKVEIDAGTIGQDFVSVWVNPDVTNLGPADATVTSDDWIGDAKIDFLRVESYYGASDFVDMVTLSDGDGNANWAFAQVIGVPEPTTFLVWSLLAGLAIGLRWRRK